MEEFIALQSKMYSWKTADGAMKKAKGIQRNIVKNANANCHIANDNNQKV